MTTTLTFYGRDFILPERDILQSPNDYVKIQLGHIVSVLKLDTIYDSMTGYPVGTLNLHETRAMLDQIWHGELHGAIQAIMEVKAFPSEIEFAEIIESGVDQLRIRMLATMRPTPALSYQRDLKAIERVRKADPDRITSMLLINFLLDLPQAIHNDFGLDALLARHEKAIAIAEYLRNRSHRWAALEKVNDRLIELDARFGIIKSRRIFAKHLDAIEAMAAECTNPERMRSLSEHYFHAMAEKIDRFIGLCEDAEIMEGNRALVPAFQEKTHEQVMAGIHAESDRLRFEEQMAIQRRQKAAKGKPAKKNPNVVRGIDFTGIDLGEIMGFKS